MDAKELFRSKVAMLSQFGYKLDAEATVLDFGCGNGQLVREFREHGYKAFGCDLEFKEGPNVDTLQKSGFIRLIHSNPYRIPFDDNTFAFVSSDQVFEHVQDYVSAISEIKRVMKPNAASLHIFPSRYSIIEPHIYVPFASIIQSRAWLYAWAILGIRNEYQHGLDFRQTSAQNFEYLKNCTNYLTKKKISCYFSPHFNNVIFCEKNFLKFSRKGHYAYYVSRIPLFFFIPALYSACRARVILADNKKN